MKKFLSLWIILKVVMMYILTYQLVKIINITNQHVKMNGDKVFVTKQWVKGAKIVNKILDNEKPGLFIYFTAFRLFFQR